MKLSVVGGAGRVGSTTLFQLVLEGAFQELAVCDIMKPRPNDPSAVGTSQFADAVIETMQASLARS